MKIKVDLKKEIDDSYNISIGKNLFSQILSFLKERKEIGKIAIITDDNVKKLHGIQLKENLEKEGILCYLISFNHGEKNKNRKTKQKLEDSLLDLGFGRDSLLISLGGGVVGDMTGFVASTLNRGIPYIQIPTTLLSMIDSSVGGKTGVDTKQGKNLIGTFHQPEAVFIDINYLNTLPQKEFINGMAEQIKHSIISDLDLFSFIEQNLDSILKKEEKTLLKCITKSCKIKSKIVNLDEKESDGIRQILNFGHTIGHVIEKESKFKTPHGFAISIGMSVEAKIANELGLIDKLSIEKIDSLLKRTRLFIKVPKEISTNNIMKSLSLDKKSKKGIPKFILISGIGKVKNKPNYSHFVDEKIIIKSINDSK